MDNIRANIISQINNESEPLLLVGPSGVGKTYIIERAAKERGVSLYSYNCRKDKTLREGRNKLISWVFLKEPCIVWLEGADDLTIEAQSFLRRSLETYSRSVILILEVRDTAFLADPLRSRCKTIIVPRPTGEEMKEFLKSEYNIKGAEANDIISKINPLGYRAVKVYVQANRLLSIKEKSIYDESADINKSIALIACGEATMKHVLEWKRMGLYPMTLIERGMAIKGLKWWPDMPVGARGRNPWFCVGYIINI